VGLCELVGKVNAQRTSRGPSRHPSRLSSPPKRSPHGLCGMAKTPTYHYHYHHPPTHHPIQATTRWIAEGGGRMEDGGLWGSGRSATGILLLLRHQIPMYMRRESEAAGRPGTSRLLAPATLRRSGSGHLGRLKFYFSAAVRPRPTPRWEPRCSTWPIVLLLT
jgi:hypothetical protein